MTELFDKELDDVAIQAIRDRVGAIIQKDGLTRARIAAECGVPEGTFGPWLNAKYAGDNASIAAKAAKWLELREVRKARAHEEIRAPGFQGTRTAEAILTTLDHAQLFGDLVLIAAKPGSGKTMACEEHQRQRPRVHLATMRPSTRGVNTALVEVLAAMGEPEARGTPQVLSRRIISRVKEPGALIILDEAQHLSVQAVEELRAIHDATKVGIAFVGDERLTAVFDARDYSQLRRRIGMRAKAPKSLDADAEMLARAWGVADATEIKFLRAVAQKPGGLGGVTKILLAATRLAVAEQTPRNLGHLRAAWEHLMPEVAL